MSSFFDNFNGDDRSLDNAAKNILSFKSVAAIILKSTNAAFKDWSVKEIAEKALEADERNQERIRLLNNESNIPGERNTRFDLFFKVTLPDGQTIYMDLDFQRNRDGNLLIRALFYGAKIITSQENSDYKETVSTWINMEPRVEERNTMVSYRLEPFKLTDGTAVEPVLTPLETFEEQGKLNPLVLTIINVGKPGSENFSGIFEFLYLLFHGEIEVVEDTFEKYDIELTKEGKEDMQEYMSLTESYLREGFEKGLKQNVENVRKETQNEARSLAVEGLMNELNISREEAEKMAKKILPFSKIDDNENN